MRISAKGRYALAAAIDMARQHGGEYITVLSIAERLGISKIYLEQVFSLLKRAGLVLSVKGAQGGYRLSRGPEQISALDILSAVELSLFEAASDTVAEAAPDIEKAIRLSAFDVLDQAVKEALDAISLAGLVSDAETHRDGQEIMFYI